MNTNQLEQFKTSISFTLLPFHSAALSVIKDNRSSISVFNLQTVSIRVITPYR